MLKEVTLSQIFPPKRRRGTPQALPSPSLTPKGEANFPAPKGRGGGEPIWRDREEEKKKEKKKKNI
jgi:hypothetical protein